MGLANYFRFIEHSIVIKFPPDDAYSIGSMYKILVVVYHGIMHTVHPIFNDIAVCVCLYLCVSVSACMLVLYTTAPFPHSFLTDLIWWMIMSFDKIQI